MSVSSMVARHVDVSVPGRSSPALVPFAAGIIALGFALAAVRLAQVPSVPPGPQALVLAATVLLVALLYGTVAVVGAEYTVCTSMGVRTALALVAPLPLVVLTYVVEVVVLALRSGERTGLKVAYNLSASLIGALAAAAVLGPGAEPSLGRLVLAATVMIAVHTLLVFVVVGLALGTAPVSWLRAGPVPVTLAVDLAVGPLLVVAARGSLLAPLLVPAFLAAAAWSVRRGQDLARALEVDDLTGLGNRRHLRDRAEVALRSVTADRPVALVLVDLDGFKAVNDRLGHPAGDAVLVEVGARLRRALRRGDVAARLGGDEFALLLTGVDATAVDGVLARLRAGLAEGVVVGGGTVAVGACTGVATAPADGTSLGALVAAADLRLYGAKGAR